MSRPIDTRLLGRRAWLLVVGLTSLLAACDDPFLPDDARHYVDVTTGGDHSCAVSESGQAYCWGRGGDGQLGQGSREDSDRPVPVAGGMTFDSISAGEAHTCALATDGRVFCWGWNAQYQLGNVGAVADAVPNAVSSAVTFTQVSAGAYHTCALSVDQRVYCWGFNRWGQGGNGTFNTIIQPEPVAGSLRAVAVSAGGSHTCALSTGGDVYCWGANDLGQLGVGLGSLTVSVPTRVVSSQSYRRVSAGTSHTCAVATSEAAFCWGGNGFGEVGDGVPFREDLAGPPTPTPITIVDTVRVISAGANKTCATDQTRLGWCWGRNDEGQLGIGTLEHRAFPTALHLLPHQQHRSDQLRFTKLAAGGTSHACGLSDGSVFCWGTGEHGQLGNPNGYAVKPQHVPD